MNDLKELLNCNGFQHVHTYLQSGNVLFESDSVNLKELSNKISSLISIKYGFDVPVLILEKKYFQMSFVANPFAKDPLLDKRKVYFLHFFKEPEVSVFNTIATDHNYSEQMLLNKKTLYMYYVNGIGKSKVNGNFFERKLNIKVTARNYNTMKNLTELLNDYPD